MTQDRIKQLIYFPYLNMNQLDEIGVDDLKLWNFDTRKDNYIKETAMKEQIEGILKTNVINKSPVSGVGVITQDGKNDFAPLEKLDTVHEIRNLLFICSVSKWNTHPRGSNIGHSMVSSENFTFIAQNFELGNKGIAVQSGYIVTKQIGGYKIGEVNFQAPQHLLIPKLNTVDWDLFSGLIKVKERNKTLYKKIHSSIDLFYESQYNDPLFSVNARVLLIMSAFETLLDLPHRQQRKIFTDIIESFTKINKDTYRTYSYKYNHRERRTIKAMWANKFYSLRNTIVHGNKTRERDYVFLNAQRHTDIAALFFVISIKKVVNKYLNRREFWDEIHWGTNESFGTKYTGFLYENNALSKAISEGLA